MHRRARAVLLVGLFVTGTITGITAADPPRPGTEDNGLDENESATLWSRDADAYITQAEYRQRYGENRSAVHQVANGTDITFQRPPATAATWTRNDFADLDAGGANTSVHPPHANLTDGVFITDAHATIFGVHPSTRGHLDANTTPRYIAPNGTLRGFVDYRVRVPNATTNGSTTTEWSVTSHEVDEVRLLADGEPIAERDGSPTPTLDYHLDDDWGATLTFEADIDVRLQQTVRADRGGDTVVNVSTRTESVTVADTIDAEVYDLSATPHYAEYPNGDTGVTVFQSRPWQGYTLTEDGEPRVRGVWRFYTARNTNWDSLVKTTRTENTTVESDALPVFVHAYPSRVGPRTEPVRTGPDLLETWGPDRASPQATLGENVTVDVVNQSYTQSSGLALRADDVDREALRVSGIVRGVNASLVEPDSGSARQLRRSNLSVDVVQQTDSEATLRVELRDAETGAPIALGEQNRQYPIGGEPRTGSITIGDQRVETNASGVATVTVAEPGIYTARYHPGSWLGHDPAYVSATATTRWHPLGTIGGWFAFLYTVGWQLLPFVVLFYAGRRLLAFLEFDDSSHRHP